MIGCRTPKATGDRALLHFAVRIEASIDSDSTAVSRTIVAVTHSVKSIQRPTHAVTVVIDDLSVASGDTGVAGWDLSVTAPFVPDRHNYRTPEDSALAV